MEAGPCERGQVGPVTRNYPRCSCSLAGLGRWPISRMGTLLTYEVCSFRLLEFCGVQQQRAGSGGSPRAAVKPLNSMHRTCVPEQWRQRRSKNLPCLQSSTSIAVFTAIHVFAFYGIPSESLAIDIYSSPIQKFSRVQPRIPDVLSLQQTSFHERSRISLHLRGGGSCRFRTGLQNPACKQDSAEIQNKFADGLQLLAALPVQVRYLLSLSVGNALYFLLYTVMLAYATNTLERAACMFFSYGGT